MSRSLLLSSFVCSVGCGLVAGLDKPQFVEDTLVVEGGVPEAAPTSVPEAAVPDAPPLAPLGPKCGATTCTGATPICCLNGEPTCVAAGDTCVFPVECDGPEDCPNRACCIKSGIFGDSGARCIDNGAACTGGLASGLACHDQTQCEPPLACKEIGIVSPLQKSEYRACQ